PDLSPLSRFPRSFQTQNSELRTSPSPIRSTHSKFHIPHFFSQSSNSEPRTQNSKPRIIPSAYHDLPQESSLLQCAQELTLAVLTEPGPSHYGHWSVPPSREHSHPVDV